jgi:hypothetical protein
MRQDRRYIALVLVCAFALSGCMTAARAKKAELAAAAVAAAEAQKAAELARAQEAEKAEEAAKVAAVAKAAEDARIAAEMKKAEELRKIEEAKTLAAQKAAEEAEEKALVLRMEKTRHVYAVGYRILKSVPLDPVKNERFCGFLVAPLDATVARVYGLTAAPESVVVFGVIPGSAVALAGLLEKDIIESIDGHPVTIGNFDSAVTAMVAGQTYAIVVNRGGVSVTLSFVPEVIRMYVPFAVSESNDVGVFASPDGVTVTYGLLNFVKNDDELAFAMAHELAHLVRGQMLKDSGIGLFSRIVAVAIAQAKSTTADPVAGGKAPIVSDLEPEADLFGVVYAHKAGYAFDAGVQVWERFAAEFPKQMTTSYVGVTQPTSLERLTRIKEISSKLKSGTFDEAEYLTKKI